MTVIFYKRLKKFSRYSVLIFIGLILYSCANTNQSKQELESLKHRLDNIQRAQVDLSVRVEELNNKLFVLGNKIDTNSKNIKEMQSMAIPVEPPEELKVVKVVPSPEKPEVLKTGKALENEKTEKEVGASKPETLYQIGYTLYKAGKKNRARRAFNKFIKTFPRHNLADNAIYWLGETYYSENDYFMALNQFKRVVRDYHNENKAPDALLKVALCYIELGNKTKAKEALDKLIDEYPASDAANTGKNKLMELGR